jgi:L-seryl-tRNA(Ser) seleniumtransferase
MTSQFRNLPSVDRIVGDERLREFEATYSHDLIVQVTRQRLDRERSSIMLGKQARTLDDIIESVRAMLLGMERPGLRTLVNATGVILHTNLGRAPLSLEAMQAMEDVSRGYSNVEFEVDSGKRGSRQSYIEPLVCQLTGAEAAMVVNNNAAAVLLGLAAMAQRKEVIVSRGQAVEIGDSFRIPDVMRQSGARLVEVGTTNCTYISDYEQAVADNTAGLMRVHSSNFQVVGFTHSTTIQELGELSARKGLALLDDLGSGCLLDTSVFGLSPEPTVQESIAAGTGLAFFSGDKLLGGPQAGIIAGRKVYVDRLRRHPLARAVRIDKVRLAGLAVTLIHYLKGEALRKIPIWVMISMPVDRIRLRAEMWAEAAGSPARVVDGESMVGGGSLPGGTLPTRLVIIPGQSRKRENVAQMLARKLRKSRIPVIARISEDALVLDPRSVFPEEDDIVIEALRIMMRNPVTGG